jgi:hypothetical protein
VGFKLDLARMRVEERMSYRMMANRINERFGRGLKALDFQHILHQRCIWHGLQTVQRLLNYMVLRQRYGQMKFRVAYEQRNLQDREAFPDTSGPVDSPTAVSYIRPLMSMSLFLQKNCLQILSALSMPSGRPEFVLMRKR